MPEKINIIGAGIAGLLAANMLRDRLGLILEASQELPNNHSAVLRFRSSVVADTLNIPFRKVQAFKAIEPYYTNPIADALAYSRKTNGTATLRSITSAKGEVSERFIAPDNLIELMARPIKDRIIYNRPITTPGQLGDEVTISTVPMPIAMKILSYPACRIPEFNHQSGTNVIVQLRGVDAYCSLYVSDPEFAGSRISITGDEMIIECYNPGIAFVPSPPKQEEIALKAIRKMGLTESSVVSISAKVQGYAKILPINDDERKRFIIWASENHKFYSFGRFATWRPGLLVDDLINDFRIITKLIDGESRYNSTKQGYSL